MRTISFKKLSTSPDNKEGFHWIGVLLCFGAASLGGLSNVATNYLKVCFKYMWMTLDLEKIGTLRFLLRVGFY